MNKRARIVDAARKRFRYYGIGKTTMQEIADDAGVAVGTLYLYFSNKDDLVVACAEEFVRRHRRRAEAILASAAPADKKLRRYVVDRFRQSEATRTSSRHAAEITRAVLRVKPDRIDEESQMMWQVIGEILAEGVRDGLFRIDRPADDAKIFLIAIAAFFPNALTEPPRMPKEQDLVSVINWFVRAWKSGVSRRKRASAGRRKETRTRREPC
jgi:AcrR family transcriptional regulator